MPTPSPPGSGPPVRRPRRVYDLGDEPDPRFTLANERTLLAWLRTALALVVTGLAVVGLSAHLAPAWMIEVVATLLFAGGGATAVYGYRSWQRTERAMRLGRPLPASSGSLGVLAVILAVAVIGAVALLRPVP